MAYRIAVVGIGKIARDQHIPCIGKNRNFALVAGVSRHGKIDGIANFESVAALKASKLKVDCVALCTPPSVRLAMARECLDAGWHVLIEKPPTPTVGELLAMEAHARKKKRVLYAEGESERVLRAVRAVVDENLARPILIGRPAVIDMRIEKFGLNLVAGRDFDVVNVESDSRYRELWQEYYRLMGRDGVTPDSAREAMRSDTTLIGCMLLRRGDGDALVCGTTGGYDHHFNHVQNLIGLKHGASLYAAMNILLLPQRILAITDTYVNEVPSAEEAAEIAMMAADELKRFGIEPKVALLSHSNFGSASSASSRRMRDARDILRIKAPDL